MAFKVIRCQAFRRSRNPGEPVVNETRPCIVGETLDEHAFIMTQESSMLFGVLYVGGCGECLTQPSHPNKSDDKWVPCLRFIYMTNDEETLALNRVNVAYNQH